MCYLLWFKKYPSVFNFVRIWEICLFHCHFTAKIYRKTLRKEKYFLWKIDTLICLMLAGKLGLSATNSEQGCPNCNVHHQRNVLRKNNLFTNLMTLQLCLNLLTVLTPLTLRISLTTPIPSTSRTSKTSPVSPKSFAKLHGFFVKNTEISFQFKFFEK